MPSNELVKFEKYEIAGIDPDLLKHTMEENLGGAEFDALDLDRVKIPSGGGITFEVPTLEGIEPKAKITGVIIKQRLVRAFWKEGLDDSGGGTPPDCTSPDNHWGYGDPGDRLKSEGRGCADCPMSDFGTAKGGEGAGQACQQRHQLFIAIPGEVLPILVSLPPTSLHAIKKYLGRLSSRVIPFYAVTTTISLKKETSGAGQDYAEAVFEFGERLAPEEIEQVRRYAEAMAPILDKVRITETPRGGDSNGAVDATAEEERAAAPPPPDVDGDASGFVTEPAAAGADAGDVPFE